MSQQYQKQKEKWKEQGYQLAKKENKDLQEAYDLLIEENNRLREKVKLAKKEIIEKIEEEFVKRIEKRYKVICEKENLYYPFVVNPMIEELKSLLEGLDFNLKQAEKK